MMINVPWSWSLILLWYMYIYTHILLSIVSYYHVNLICDLNGMIWLWFLWCVLSSRKKFFSSIYIFNFIPPLGSFCNFNATFALSKLMYVVNNLCVSACIPHFFFPSRVSLCKFNKTLIYFKVYLTTILSVLKYKLVKYFYIRINDNIKFFF